MPAFVKQSGWNRTLHFTKVSTSTWKTVSQIYVKTSGGWKPLYGLSWEVGSWGKCNKGCGGGTQTRTVQCKREDGSILPDAACTAVAGAKPNTTQMCNSQSCNYYMYGNYDDCARLYTLTSSNSWRTIYNQCGAHSGNTYKEVTSPEFAEEEVKMLYAMWDANGTSYNTHLQMCTATNKCSSTLVSFGHQGECGGLKLYFTWKPSTLEVKRVRCVGVGHYHPEMVRCDGCSGCTDGGIGYINCNSGAPEWAYINIP